MIGNFCFFLISSFSNYFPNTPFLLENNLSSRFILQNFNYYLNNNFFSNLHTINQNGGAILMNNINNISIVIESTVFYKCSIQGTYNGGAIYYNSQYSNLLMNKICSSYCNTSPWDVSTNMGHSQFIYSHISQNFLNFGQYLSVNYCYSYDNNGLWRVLTFYYGIQTLKNSNFSNNINRWCSSIDSYHSDKFIQSFSNINKNIASRYAIQILANSNLNNISFSNYLNNSQSLTSYGMFMHGIDGISSFTEFFNCIFKNNNPNNGAFFFYISSGTILINKCFYDWLIATPSHLIFNDVMTNSNTLFLYHFSTVFCQAANPIPEITQNYENGQLRSILFQFFFNTMFTKAMAMIV